MVFIVLSAAGVLSAVLHVLLPAGVAGAIFFLKVRSSIFFYMGLTVGNEYGKEGIAMYFIVWLAGGNTLYEGESWPMARAALDHALLNDKGLVGMITYEEKPSQDLMEAPQS